MLECISVGMSFISLHMFFFVESVPRKRGGITRDCGGTTLFREEKTAQIPLGPFNHGDGNEKAIPPETTTEWEGEINLARTRHGTTIIIWPVPSWERE